MPIIVNLRHLESHNVRLTGEVPLAELDIDTRDEVIQVVEPLAYDFEVQRLEDGLLLQGQLRLGLRCQCVRCLKSFQHPLVLDPWTAHVPLHGEDAVRPINDCVDLTPVVREDILLEFPRHPLCDPGCGGLPNLGRGQKPGRSGMDRAEQGSPAWAELNKLKIEPLD